MRESPACDYFSHLITGRSGWPSELNAGTKGWERKYKYFWPPLAWKLIRRTLDLRYGCTRSSHQQVAVVCSRRPKGGNRKSHNELEVKDAGTNLCTELACPESSRSDGPRLIHSRWSRTDNMKMQNKSLLCLPSDLTRFIYTCHFSSPSCALVPMSWSANQSHVSLIDALRCQFIALNWLNAVGWLGPGSVVTELQK